MTASTQLALTMNILSINTSLLIASLDCADISCFEYHTVSVSHHYAVIINAVGYDHEYPFYKCIIVNSLYSLYDCINAVGTMNSFSMYSLFHIGQRWQSRALGGKATSAALNITLLVCTIMPLLSMRLAMTMNILSINASL